jgi:hypothetical protein
MLPRLCSRVWLRVAVVKLEGRVKCTKIATGFANLVEHERCIVTNARERKEGYTQQTRFCSHSETVKGLVLRLHVLLVHQMNP